MSPLSMLLPTLAPLLWRLLSAGLISVIAGLLLWSVLSLAVRRWPALAASRSVWLGAQGLLACAFVVALLPHTARLSVLPAVTLSAPAPAPLMPRASTAPLKDPASTAPATQFAAASVTPAPEETDAASGWLMLAPAGLLLLYPLGLLLQLRRLRQGQRLWRALLSGAQRLHGDDLQRHPGFTAAQRADVQRLGLQVVEVDAAISPMLLGLRAPRLLLPRHVRSFSAEQQQLIVEHELTHSRRRDPALLALASLLQTLFWYNPVMGWLTARLVWAQELGCDQHVLHGRPQQQRQSYAAALVQQLKLQSLSLHGGAQPRAGMAFGAIDAGSVGARIMRMRQSGAARVSALSVSVVAGAMLVILAGSALLQPAWAWSEPATSMAAPQPASANVNTAPEQPWRAPLEQMRVSSFYRVVSGLLPDGHHGIDLVARRGTPIHAVAAGTVLSAGSDARYGNFVVIEHADGKRSLYAHLQQMAVRNGDALAAGQVIGTVGATGMATGPHLHFEAYQGEQRIDPQQLLAGLDGNATARALRVRKTQFGY